MLQKLVSLAVPMSVALAAFSLVHAIGSQVDTCRFDALGPDAAPASIAPFAEARAEQRASGPEATRSASALLERDPLGPSAGPSLREAADREADARAAPPCEDVRAVASVGGDEPEALAARGVASRGRRDRGRSIADLRVVYVGADRVWLERNGALCQTRVL